MKPLNRENPKARVLEALGRVESARYFIGAAHRFQRPKKMERAVNDLDRAVNNLKDALLALWAGGAE